MTGEMFYRDLHLFWQDLTLLALYLVAGKCDAADEFGRTDDRILESSPLMYFPWAQAVSG